MQTVFPITEAALYANHKQDKRKDGEWIVYTCKQCPGYERRVHVDTGKVTQKGHLKCPANGACQR